MVDITLLVIVVGEVEASIGTVRSIVTMSCGNDATDGEAAVNMRIWAMLKGVSEGLTVDTAWGGMARE